MTKKTTAWAVMVLLFCWGSVAGAAQEKTEGSAKAATQGSERQGAYRLDFSVNEIRDGKRINTRQYSIDLKAGGEAHYLKIGTRVPVQTGETATGNTQFQYIDVGTGIEARVRERDGEVTVEATVEISDFALPEQQQAQTKDPIIRQMKVKGSTVATLGKPIVIGTADDPNSKRQFQVEVTLTKAK
jgi:hypothetical protein